MNEFHELIQSYVPNEVFASLSLNKHSDQDQFKIVVETLKTMSLPKMQEEMRKKKTEIE